LPTHIAPSAPCGVGLTLTTGLSICENFAQYFSESFFIVPSEWNFLQ
jgi:hypothetical protein